MTRTSAVAALILNVLYCLLALALLLWVFHWGRVSTMVVALLLLAVVIIPRVLRSTPADRAGRGLHHHLIRGPQPRATHGTGARLSIT